MPGVLGAVNRELPAVLPATIKLRDGLALFAAVVVVRFLLQRFRASVYKRRSTTASGSASQKLSSSFTSLKPVYYPHPTFASDQAVHSGRIFSTIMTGETRHTSPTGSVRPSSDQKAAATTATTTTAPAGQPRGSDSFMSQPNPDYVNYANSASTAGVVPPQQSPGARTTSLGYGHPPMQVVNVQGEYISVRDSNGAGWSRHTVVYGGGGGGQGCAGCAAAGRRHGQGGSYGPNVTAEEKQRDAEVAASNKNAAAGPGGNA